MGCCPFHNEKNPSFYVNDKKGLYNCFSCGAKGDVITYLEQKHNYSFKEAVEYLANYLGIPLPQITKKENNSSIYEIYEQATVFFEESLELYFDQERKKESLNFFEEREISNDIIKKFRLGYCLDNQSLYNHLRKNFDDKDLEKSGIFLNSKTPKFYKRIIFPIRNKSGKVIAFGGRALNNDHKPKYLNSPETEIFKKKQSLYGIYESQRKNFIVVEGYTDVIRIIQSGYESAVAPLGTAISHTQIDMLWKYEKNPIICLDGDIAGQKAQKTLIEKILPYIESQKTLRFMTLFNDYDPDKLLLESPSTFRQLKENAKNLIDTLWTYLEKSTEYINPESIIETQEKINSLTKLIKQKSLAKTYNTTLSKLLWKNYYKNKVDISNYVPPKPVKNTEILQEILLATIIKHPIMLNEVSENLGRIRLNDKLEHLRNHILESYHGNETISVEDKIFDFKKLEIFAPFLRDKVPFNMILLGWYEIWQILNQTTELKTSWKDIKKIKSIYIKDGIYE